MRGEVKWFSDKKGYGFITGEDGKDYFTHYKEIAGEEEGWQSLHEGQQVEFDIQQAEKRFGGYKCP